MRKFVLIFIFFFLTLSKSFAQVKFELIATAKKDTVYYSLKYHGPSQFNGVSVTCNWLTMREDVYFFSPYPFGGLNYVRSSGIFPGNKYKFKHKVSAGYDYDVFLDSGQQQVFAYCENFGTIPDTILCANLEVYGSINDKNVKYSVYPSGQNDCPFERVYCQAGLTINGISLGSFANTTLHQSKDCDLKVVAVVFNQYTLQPVSLGAFLPNCADGRKWKSFGYPTDDQVFFDFNLKTDSGQKYFSDFVDAIETGDHVFLATAKRNQFVYKTNVFKNALFKLGLDLNTYNGISTQYDLLAAYGRKGLKSGKMKFFASWANDHKQYEIFMLSGQPLDTSFDFAPCYEVLTKKILEQQPKIGLNQIQKLSQVKVFPNPTQKNWSVFSNTNCNFTVFNAQMQVVKQFGVLAAETYELNASDLPTGIYFLKNDSGSILKIVKSSN
jgi:hypothetical protein